MSYAAPSDLLAYGARELSELLAVDGAGIDPALLRLTINNGDRGAYTPAEQADADEAMLALEVACADADLEIDSYLGQRYPVPVRQAPPRLIQIARRIARYNLYLGVAPDGIDRHYRDAVAWLKQVGAGQTTVPGLTETTTGTAGSPQSDAPGRTWTGDTLRDF